MPSLCRAISTDIHDYLSPAFPIIHCPREVFCAASSILAQLVNVGPWWATYISMSMCCLRQENVTYELVLASPACLVRLTLIVCEIGGRWPYSCILVECCFHDLFKTARCILVQLPSSLFSRGIVRVQVVQP